VVITDSKAFVEYKFKLNVINFAPRVTSIIPKYVLLTFGQDLIYPLPFSEDPEG
jgi:hypothetical protein